MELNPPVVITDVKTITSFEINSIEVILNTSAQVFVYLRSADNIVASEMIAIEGVDYASWAADDQYVINYINNFIRNKYIV